MRFKERLKRTLSKRLTLDWNRNVRHDLTDNKCQSKPLSKCDENHLRPLYSGVTAWKSSTNMQNAFTKNSKRTFKQTSKYSRNGLLGNRACNSVTVLQKNKTLDQEAASNNSEFPRIESAVHKLPTKILRVEMPTRNKRNTETVDFSGLVKPVDYPRAKMCSRQSSKSLRMQRENQHLSKSELTNDRVTSVEKSANVYSKISRNMRNTSKNGASVCESSLDARVKDDQFLKKGPGPAKEINSVLAKELSPTCSDIYGNDEEEDSSFSLCQKLVFAQNVVEQGVLKADSNLVQTNQDLDHSFERKRIEKCLPKSENDERDSMIGFCKNKSEMDKSDNKSNKYSMPRKCSPLNGSIGSIEVTKHDVSFESPWVLQCEARGDDVSVDETDKYCSVELVEKSLPPVLARLEKGELYRSDSLGFDVSHQSLGFDVNHSCDVTRESFRCEVNERCVNNADAKMNKGNKKLSRCDSKDSLNSFGSSVHTAESNEFLFFSDSEAEHNHSGSDLEEPQKQIIPYALSEGLRSSGGSPKRKVKKVKSKSIEEKINEIAKHMTQLIDTKIEENSADKKKVFGAKQSKSVEEVRENDNKKVKTLNRRSLDSNIMKKEIDGSFKRKSVLANSTELLLSPVLEAEGKVSRRLNSRKSTNTENEDQKFYTLPNPRKHRKLAQSPKRKISRLGSLSKIFTDKAQSLSNLKLSSSFKLRNESETSDTTWGQLSQSANSLANKMVKKASKYSTLIRRRTNSNTMVDSPFCTNRTRKSKPKDEDLIELVYEKVLVNVPRKKPATNQEKKSQEKRLKLNIDLAKCYRNTDMESKSIIRQNSLLIGQRNSESPSGLQSPTLLDEIMKSVDAVRVRELCSIGDMDDGEDSSDCESSSGSSMLMFSNKDSKRDSLLASFCRVCGKIRNPSDGSVESSDGDQVFYPNRLAISLCDLTAKCACAKHRRVRKHCQSRGSRLFDCGKNNRNSDRKSWDIIIGDRIDRLGTPIKDVKSCSMSELGSSKCASRNSLQIDTEQTAEKVEPKLKDSSEFLQMTPGSLFRHQPVMDLSSDNLDNTVDSEFDLPNESAERKCLSCGDLLDYSKQGSTSPEKNGTMKMEGSEVFHSCNEVNENEDSEISRSNRNSQKSHSCGNLLDSGDIVICDQLQQKELSKRELRKLKVKSMSSSHDVLNNLVPTVTIDIEDADDAIDDVINGYKDTNEQKVESEAKEKNETNENEKKIVNILNERKENDYNLGNSTDKNKLTVPDIVSAKPPLPFKKTHKKVMSLGDIDISEDKENMKLGWQLNKRHSMVDCLPLAAQNKAELFLCSNCDKKLKDNDSIMLNTAKPVKTCTMVPQFAFDDKHVQEYIKAQQHRMLLPRQRSISSNELNQSKTPDTEKLYTAHSMNRLLQDSWSDEVFHGITIPPHLPFSSQHAHGIASPSLELKDQFSPFEHSKTFPGLSPFGSGKLLPEFSHFGEESVYKYDVGLGYLLHSLQCDNMVISVYSFQRNKQFMESVITPLSSLPGSPHTKPSLQNSVNKQKVSPGKQRPDEQPNPAAPITQVPSVRLAHAGHVLRTVLLARAPHMIRDRKFHLRTYRRCMVGTEMVDWLLQQSSLVHSRTQAVGMWQALIEEGVVVHVCHEHQFKDKYLFYRFHDDDEGVSTVPSASTKRECEEDLADVFMTLAQIGPDAMMRMILRKPSHERTSEDLEIIYEELLHIKALSHLSTMVKRELASVLVFESHAKAGTVLFNQGDEGKSWYIILKGSVNVVIYGKGVVCTLHEGDDFGKLALVNDAPRAATIVLRDDNCHFLRVDKDDFNRILRDVEANTVRLKEHGQDVLVLEKIPTNTQSPDGTVHQHYKYSVMAGTPEKMLEHLLEGHLDNKNETEIDGFLEDFLLTHVIFMPYNHLCPVLLSHYHSSTADSDEQEGLEFMLNHKKCVLHFVQEWANIVGVPFKQDHTINAFLEELLSCVTDDIEDYPSLNEDLASLKAILNAQNGSPNSKLKKRSSGTFLLSRKTSKECFQDLPKKREPIKRSDDIIIKVYCADHSYTTLKLPMDARVETLLASTVEKLGLGEDIILCEVKSTGERLIFKDNDLCVTTGLGINGRLFVTPKEHIDALTPLPEQEGPSEGSFTMIETFSSREMAYHMTLYDWELFTCVQEYELIYQVFGRHKFGKITANLDVFLRRFNEIQFWVVTEMVLASNLSKRVSLLRKFIKIAAHCKEFQNLNSFFAIVMGLSNIAVSRLSQTWEKLPGKFKKMFADFETLMDPSRNHRVYRLSVAKMQPTIIPFMPLLMKDMTFTHEGNKTYFESLVNFEKMHMIAQTLKTVRFCRSAPLDLEAPSTMKSTETSEYIRDLHVIDNQRLLTQLSHKLEPRKT